MPDRIQLVTLAWLERHAPSPTGDPVVFTGDELADLATRFRVGADSSSDGYCRGDWRVAQLLTTTAHPDAFPAIWSTDAEGGERYRCRDHGCDCGWTYTYAPGEPMAVPAAVREST